MEYVDSEYCSEEGKPIDDRHYTKTGIKIKRYGPMEPIRINPLRELLRAHKIVYGED